MPAPDFETFRERLRQAGIRERNARNDEAAFGSWLIEPDTEPQRRIVWDGKDGWLIVQALDGDEWKDERVLRNESEQTADDVIAILESFRGHS